MRQHIAKLWDITFEDSISAFTGIKVTYGKTVRSTTSGDCEVDSHWRVLGGHIHEEYY